MFVFLPTDFYAWQWKDERGNWNPYSVENTIKLEKARLGNEDSVGIMAARRSYTINIPDMEQVNDDTNVTREVHRVQSGQCE